MRKINEKSLELIRYVICSNPVQKHRPEMFNGNLIQDTDITWVSFWQMIPINIISISSVVRFQLTQKSRIKLRPNELNVGIENEYKLKGFKLHIRKKSTMKDFQWAMANSQAFSFSKWREVSRSAHFFKVEMSENIWISISRLQIR